MSVTISAHKKLGVPANSYSIVDGFINNVRLWPGSDGRQPFRRWEDETPAAFMLRVPREVAVLRVRFPRP